jgi:patched 1 protein
MLKSLAMNCFICRSSVTLNLFSAWKLKDLCYAQTIPLTKIQMLDSIFENLFPCTIITPLDCFWEGSKLLGPDHPVHVP